MTNGPFLAGLPRFAAPSKLNNEVIRLCLQVLPALLFVDCKPISQNRLSSSFFPSPLPFLTNLKPNEVGSSWRGRTAQRMCSFPRQGETKRSVAVLTRSSPRLISTGQLHPSQGFHLRPINDVVYIEPYLIKSERSHLRGSFTLRCLQRLSRPNVAIQLCPWQDNWCTRGSSIPVLSY